MGRPVVHRELWSAGRGSAAGSIHRCLAYVLLVLCGAAVPASVRVDADSPMSVGILLFEGVQIIDFTGPYEVFGQAGMKVWTASADGAPITTHMGLRVMPTHALDGARARVEITSVPDGEILLEVEVELDNGRS